jgi:cytochrome c biogenesis protein CcdA
MLSREISGGSGANQQSGEINWSLGTWLPRQEVEKAFGVSDLPKPEGVAPNQPFPHKKIYLYWLGFLAVIFVLGIALMFSTVGVAVALSGGLFGAAMQNPFVLIALASMLLVLAASNFGLFSLQPPQWMLQSAGVARPGYAGAMLMGLGMGVVAAPCIGPIVLGLLLMVERSGSAIFGFALFFTLAIGLGVPYVGLAVAAGSIRRLPRSGEWLAWIEQLFGFVLIGLAIYFLDPVVPRHLMMRALPYYAVAVGIFLGFISPAGKNWRPSKSPAVLNPSKNCPAMPWEKCRSIFYAARPDGRRGGRALRQNRRPGRRDGLPAPSSGKARRAGRGGHACLQRGEDD